MGNKPPASASSSASGSSSQLVASKTQAAAHYKPKDPASASSKPSTAQQLPPAPKPPATRPPEQRARPAPPSAPPPPLGPRPPPGTKGDAGRHNASFASGLKSDPPPPGPRRTKDASAAAVPPPRRASQRVREAWYNTRYLNNAHVGRSNVHICPACRTEVDVVAADMRFTAPCETCQLAWPVVVARMTPDRPGREQWVRAVAPPAKGATTPSTKLEWVRMLKGSEEKRLLESLEGFRLITDKMDLLERLVKLESMATDESTLDELAMQCTVATAWHSRELAHAAFCREFLPTGLLGWRPAASSSLDTENWMTDLAGGAATSDGSVQSTKIDPNEIVRLRETASLQERLAWFRERTAELRAAEGSAGSALVVKVRREAVLEDASTCFMTIKPKELRRSCKYEFIGEDAIDAGGVAREFFSLVSSQLFDVAFGLFELVRGEEGLISYRINVNSGIANDLHLQYFRFIGRLLGKALLDGMTLPCHLSREIYKHLLREPVSLTDVALVDAQLGKSLIDVMESDDVESLCLDFTTAVWNLGVTNTVELCENGSKIDVNRINVEKYLSLMLRNVMLDRHLEQLSFLVRGFDEMVPPLLVSVFNAREFEDLLSGLETVDVEDWMAHTDYRGAYVDLKEDHEVVDWFWTCVKAMSHDQRARLLQFATGSARVPIQGFRALQGDDGNILEFSIESVPLKTSVYPRAHTCFNRIELPLYESQEQLEQYVNEVCAIGVTGFNLE